jgi:hypothetical protein
MMAVVGRELTPGSYAQVVARGCTTRHWRLACREHGGIGRPCVSTARAKRPKKAHPLRFRNQSGCRNITTTVLTGRFAAVDFRQPDVDHTKRFVYASSRIENYQQPEHQALMPLSDGERRTRTADTTIFSRYVLAAQRREIPGNERFLRVGLALLIFAICAGFRAFQGMAGLSSPFWPRGLLRR